MTVFEFIYTDCIHESAMRTISIHETSKGANEALRKHKDKKKKEWEEMYPSKKVKKMFPFGEMEHWDVVETKVRE